MHLSSETGYQEFEGFLASETLEGFETNKIVEVIRHELRPHQTNAKTLIRESMLKGNRKIMCYGPCSFGKTLLAANLFADAVKKGKRCIFICDRTKLIEQALDEFQGYGLEVGAIQSMNPRTNPRAPIQVASIQTLEKRRNMPEFDFCIIDEAHSLRKSMIDLMEAYNNVYFIGLSATPYSKGLGQHYTDLIVPITPRELLDQGFLCPVRYYAGVTPDMTGVPTVQIPTGGRDYNPNKTEIVMSDPKLIGDGVAEWKEKANGMCTIAFNVSRAASEAMVDEFNNSGINAVHIDAYTPPEERAQIFKDHHDGKIKVLSCCTLLDTGYNEKKVQCLIDRSPTKSLIRYVQKGGRIQRILEGKEFAIYLDQAGNVDRFGMFVEDVVPTELHDGEKKYREKELTKKPSEEREARKCPRCSDGVMAGLTCLKCGHTAQSRREHVETVKGKLEEIKVLPKEKKAFMEGLLTVGENRKSVDNVKGWAAHKYKAKFGEWPRHYNLKPGEVTAEVTKFIKSQDIRYAKGKAKTKKAASTAVDNIMKMVSK